MKIVFFYQYFGTPKGSWSTRVYEMTRRWVAAGHSVTIITAPYEKSDVKAKSFLQCVKIEGIDVIIVNTADSNRNSFFKRAYKSFLFSIVSIYFALTLNFDLVICSSGPITIGLPGLFAKWFRRKRLVFEVRDLWPQGAIELGLIRSKRLISICRWFEKLCYKNSSLVVPCSIGMEDGVLNVFDSARTLVIPNASDPLLFLDHPSPPSTMPSLLLNKKIFLYAGSLGLMDECEQIVKAMDIILDDSIVLVVAGEGTEKSHLEELAAKSDKKNIYFIGLLPKTEIVHWFSIATATFVTFKHLPVLQTSSPNKMFDSFAAGRPIIQSTTGWIYDLVLRENCGINVAPDDPKQFADAIELLANQNDLRELMANNAKRLANTLFNRDRLAAAYLLELENIISN